MEQIGAKGAKMRGHVEECAVKGKAHQLLHNFSLLWGVLKQGVFVWPRLASTSWSFCLGFLGTVPSFKASLGASV